MPEFIKFELNNPNKVEKDGYLQATKKILASISSPYSNSTLLTPKSEFGVHQEKLDH